MEHKIIIFTFTFLASASFGQTKSPAFVTYLQGVGKAIFAGVHGLNVESQWTHPDNPDIRWRNETIQKGLPTYYPYEPAFIWLKINMAEVSDTKVDTEVITDLIIDHEGRLVWLVFGAQYKKGVKQFKHDNFLEKRFPNSPKSQLPSKNRSKIDAASLDVIRNLSSLYLLF